VHCIPPFVLRETSSGSLPEGCLRCCCGSATRPGRSSRGPAPLGRAVPSSPIVSASSGCRARVEHTLRLCHPLCCLPLHLSPPSLACTPTPFPRAQPRPNRSPPLQPPSSTSPAWRTSKILGCSSPPLQACKAATGQHQINPHPCQWPLPPWLVHPLHPLLRTTAAATSTRRTSLPILPAMVYRCNRICTSCMCSTNCQ
jgi:hypothetical protein